MIEQDNCCIIQQIVNENYFTAKNTVVMQRFAILRSNCSNLRISQDICYVRITDNKDVHTIYGHRANLLNNNSEYFVMSIPRSRSCRGYLSPEKRGLIARAGRSIAE